MNATCPSGSHTQGSCCFKSFYEEGVSVIKAANSSRLLCLFMCGSAWDGVRPRGLVYPAPGCPCVPMDRPGSLRILEPGGPGEDARR